MKNIPTPRPLLTALALILAMFAHGCGEDDATDTADQDTSAADVADTSPDEDASDDTADAEEDAVDAAEEDTADTSEEDVADDTTEEDATEEDATDAPEDVGDAEEDTTGCEGSGCSETNLSATFDAASATLDHAYYGLTAPALSSSGLWEIYVEAYTGGAVGCPDETSPTPDRTLIISGLIAPPEAPGDVSSVLFDFEGLLTAEPLLRADAASATITDADVCLDACLDATPPRDPDGFVDLDVDITFPGGAIMGTVHATHCDSFDALTP